MLATASEELLVLCACVTVRQHVSVSGSWLCWLMYLCILGACVLLPHHHVAYSACLCFRLLALTAYASVSSLFLRSIFQPSLLTAATMPVLHISSPYVCTVFPVLVHFVVVLFFPQFFLRRLSTLSRFSLFCCILYFLLVCVLLLFLLSAV